MPNALFKEYRFRFYLNANHYIIIDGNAGDTHPHTWEFTIDILVDNNEFIEFNKFEKGIEKFFSKYQNKVINEIPPFDHTNPTLENMADYFIYDLQDLVSQIGGTLTKMECSETPTRSYIIGFEQDSAFLHNMRKSSDDKLTQIIDTLIDDIIDDDGISRFEQE